MTRKLEPSLSTPTRRSVSDIVEEGRRIIAKRGGLGLSASLTIRPDLPPRELASPASYEHLRTAAPADSVRREL